MDARTIVSIVVPVFNEAANLRPLYEAIVREMEKLPLAFELVFVDDGSRDGSMAVLRQLAEADPRVRVIGLSRNFGHQQAVTAGMDHAAGDAVVVMDGDLQHPPELLPTMIAAWREGAQVVYTIRDDAEDSGLFKRWTSAAFYRLLNAISDVKLVRGAADFRLMDRKVVDCLAAMPERSRFLRGMVRWVGFRQTGIRFVAPPRRSGKSKYSLGKMVALAMEGITSFSWVPLRISTCLGFLAALAGVPYAIWAVYARCFTDLAVPGWSSLMVAVLFLGGVQLMSLGIIGEYLGRIFAEVKHRPLYVVDERIGRAVSEQAAPERTDGPRLRLHGPHLSQDAPAREQVPDRQCG